MWFLDLLKETSRWGTPNCTFSVHVGHPVNEITQTHRQDLEALPKAVSLLFSTMCVNVTGKSAPLWDEVSVERAIPHPHTGEVPSPLTFDGSRLSTSFTINHIHHPSQTFPLQPLARDLHSQGRHLALKETKFPQPFFFFLKTTSVLVHSFFSSAFNFRENLCLILYLEALNMDV